MAIDEEVQQEIEVLESIYPDELTIIAEDELRIRIPLEEPVGTSHQNDDDDDYTPPTLVLTVKLPASYPSVAPDLTLIHDSSTPKSTLDFPADRDSILSSLSSTIEDSLGMAMIFALVSSIKEVAESILQKRHDEAEAALHAAAAEEEEREMAKFRGTPVTRETFSAWREKFRAEMEEKKRQREKEWEEQEKSKRGGSAGVAGSWAAEMAMRKRMTGKQLYLSGTVGDEDDAEVETVDVAALKLDDKVEEK